MSLRAEAYENIREKILRRELAFDELTSERVIAEEHVHMSRTPVREALAVLIATGVLEQTPQVGVRVRHIDAEQALRAVRLRIGMEPVMADEVASLSDPNLAELQGAVSDMIHAYERDDEIAFMLADTHLHTELARQGGFATSVTGLQGLRDEVHLFRLDTPLTSSEMSDVLREHAALIEAIEGHHPRRAEHAAIAHLQATRARIDGAEAGEVVGERELEISR
jgi:DNA-binding GntR family transcriptional regulator